VEEEEFVQYFSDALSSDPQEFNSTVEDFMMVRRSALHSHHRRAHMCGDSRSAGDS